MIVVENSNFGRRNDFLGQIVLHASRFQGAASLPQWYKLLSEDSRTETQLGEVLLSIRWCARVYACAFPVWAVIRHMHFARGSGHTRRAVTRLQVAERRRCAVVETVQDRSGAARRGCRRAHW